MKRALTLISWIFSAFFAILALSVVPSFSSLFFFLTAILLLPLEKWQTLLRKFLKKGIQIITIVVTIILAFFFIPDIDTPEESNTQRDNDTSTSTSISTPTSISTYTSITTTTTSKISSPTTTTAIITTTTVPVTTDATKKPTTTTLHQDITILQEPNTVSPNELTTVSIKGVPNTKYTISVYYSSGASKADGLEDKISDGNGNVSWTWKVGGKTKSGTYRIVIKGGGQETTLYFTVT